MTFSKKIPAFLPFGQTAFYWAVSQKQEAAAIKLLEAGADPNIQTQTPPGEAKWHIRENALLVAASIGDLETTKILLDNGACVRLSNSQVLKIASKTDNENIIREIPGIFFYKTFFYNKY